MTKLTLPGLHGGVSQQAPQLRMLNQHENASNVVFDLMEGIRMPRYGTDWVTKLASLQAALMGRQVAYIKEARTTDDELWIIVVDSLGNVLVTSLTSGVVTELAGAASYLGPTVGNIESLQLLDTLFLLNKRKVVTVLTTGDLGTGMTAYLQIPEMYDDLDYSFTIQVMPTVTTTYATANNALKVISYSGNTGIITRDALNILLAENLLTTHVAFANLNSTAALLASTGHTITLVNAIVSHGGNLYELKDGQSHLSVAGQTPNLLPLVWTDRGADPGTNAYDAWGAATNYLDGAELRKCQPEIRIQGSGLPGWLPFTGYNLVPHVSPTDPTSAVRFVLLSDGYEGLPTGFDNLLSFPGIAAVFRVAPHYYVTWDESTGNYVECAAPRERLIIRPENMPHVLSYDGAAWTVGMVAAENYSYREVGDSVSAPLPLFVGRTIESLFFYRDRLCYLSENSCSLSAARDYYRHFPKTAAEVLDDDPISVTPTSKSFQKLLGAIPYAKLLVLWSSDRQFILHSGYESLTPQTVAMDETTGYHLPTWMSPVLLESALMYPLSNGEYLGLEIVRLSESEVALEGTNVTRQVPSWIPLGTGTPTRLLYVPGAETIVVWYQESSLMYTLKMSKDAQGQLTQAAWTRWDMPEAVSLVWLEDSNKIRMMTKDTQIVLEMTLDYSTADTIVLDYKVTGALPAGYPSDYLTYNATTKKIDSSGTIHGFSIENSYVDLSTLVPRDQNGMPLKNVHVTLENMSVEWSGGSFEFYVNGVLKKTVVPETYTMERLVDGGSLEETAETRLLLMDYPKRTAVRLKKTDEDPFVTRIHSVTYNLDITKDWG